MYLSRSFRAILIYKRTARYTLTNSLISSKNAKFGLINSRISSTKMSNLSPREEINRSMTSSKKVRNWNSNLRSMSIYRFIKKKHKSGIRQQPKYSMGRRQLHSTS